MRFLFFPILALAAAAAGAQTWAWDDGTTPFVVSPEAVVERMLRLAEPKAGELLIDLGSGDGRIVIEAAKRYGAKGLGVDINPKLVELARENAVAAGVESLVRFEQQDLFETDLRAAGVVTMYLLPEVNRKLVPRLLEQLRPGARIVSHDYDLGPWPFDEMIELVVTDKEIGPQGRSRIFLWVVPAQAAGRWESEIPLHGDRWQFEIRQNFQELEVQARVAAGSVLVQRARMLGEEIHLAATGLVRGRAWNHLFRGRLADDRIEGELRISDGETGKTLPWKATRER